MKNKISTSSNASVFNTKYLLLIVFKLKAKLIFKTSTFTGKPVIKVVERYVIYDFYVLGTDMYILRFFSHNVLIE